MTVLWTVLAVIGWVLLGIVALLLLVLFTPIRVKFEYDVTWRIKVMVFGCIRVFSMAGDSTPKKASKTAPSQQDEMSSDKPAGEDDKTKNESDKKPSLVDEIKALYRDEGVKGVLSFFSQMLKLLTGTLARIVRFITIRKLELVMRIGGKTADDTALQYGRICAALFPSLSALSLAVRCRKTSVHVQPDFLNDGTQVYMRTTLWIWPFGIVWAALCAFLRFILVRTALPKLTHAKTGTIKNDTKTS